MKTFEIPAADGFVNVRAFFINLRGQIRVDDSVAKFLYGEDGRFVQKEPFACNMSEGLAETAFGDLLGERAALTPSQACAILAHLGGGGWRLLDIPTGREEVNILLGWILAEGELLVLYVEHEQEPGKSEEVHLHAATPGKVEDEPVLVLFPVL